MVVLDVFELGHHIASSSIDRERGPSEVVLLHQSGYLLLSDRVSGAIDSNWSIDISGALK